MTRFLDEKVEEKENSDEEDYEDDEVGQPEIIQVARADRDDGVEDLINALLGGRTLMDLDGLAGTTG